MISLPSVIFPVRTLAVAGALGFLLATGSAGALAPAPAPSEQARSAVAEPATSAAAKPATSAAAEPATSAVAEPATSAAAKNWKGRFCTSTSCRGAEPSRWGHIAGFGAAVLATGLLARRRSVRTY